jgi:hypothetical protein
MELEYLGEMNAKIQTCCIVPMTLASRRIVP